MTENLNLLKASALNETFICPSILVKSISFLRDKNNGSRLQATRVLSVDQYERMSYDAVPVVRSIRSGPRTLTRQLARYLERMKLRAAAWFKPIREGRLTG
jgi:hypothetical protein